MSRPTLRRVDLPDFGMPTSIPEIPPAVYRDRLQRLRQRTYASLTAWQRTQLARHPKRPHTRDWWSPASLASPVPRPIGPPTTCWRRR